MLLQLLKINILSINDKCSVRRYEIIFENIVLVPFLEQFMRFKFKQPSLNPIRKLSIEFNIVGRNFKVRDTFEDD